jgi:hypothetical protein
LFASYRDESGQPASKEDRLKVGTSGSDTAGCPDWQDPELLADIKAQTGIDLKIKSKSERKKNKKFPGNDAKTFDQNLNAVLRVLYFYLKF